MNLREFKGWFEKNVQFHIVNFPFQFLHLFGDFPGRFAHPCARWQFENDRHTAWKPLKPRKPWHSSDKTHMARIHVYVFLVCYVIYIIYNYIHIVWKNRISYIRKLYIYIEYISISHIESSIISCETGKNFSISPLYLIDSHYISMI